MELGYMFVIRYNQVHMVFFIRLARIRSHFSYQIYRGSCISLFEKKPHFQQNSIRGLVAVKVRFLNLKAWLLAKIQRAPRGARCINQLRTTYYSTRNHQQKHSRMSAALITAKFILTSPHFATNKIFKMKDATI